MQAFKQQHRLSRRIIIAFVLMAAVISALFSIGIIVVVQVVEKQLLTNTLHGDLTLAMSQFSAGRNMDLQPGSRFYHDTLSATDELTEPPEWLGQLDSGFHEVFREGQAYHALVYQQGDERFLFLRDQTDFEKRERALFLIIAAGFLLSVIAAWILGYLLAKRIMSPVSQLASQVRQRDQLLVLAPALAPHYADDEVGQLAAAFDGALDQIRQALERERFFTSDVSHELRTPLTVIATSCELLLAADSLSAKQREQLQRVQRACREMRELVHTFLQLARDNLGNTNTEDKTTLGIMAQEQYQQWKPIAEAKGLQLLIEEEVPDAGQLFNTPLLRAVLANLLRNAVHYTEEGFVRLVLLGDSFRVEDSGKGIEETQQEAVFRPFVRGEGARGEGLGLGLSLVKRICAHQGWQIGLSNREPTGSCFTVSLN